MPSWQEQAHSAGYGKTATAARVAPSRRARPQRPSPSCLLSSGSELTVLPSTQTSVSPDTWQNSWPGTKSIPSQEHRCGRVRAYRTNCPG